MVLVNGLPGSGKSTLARPLAARLGLPLFSKDAIKETLADELPAPAGVAPRDWSRMLGAAAGESMWTLLAHAGRGAVLESPWLSGVRPFVVAGLARAGVERVHEVYCEAPPELARRRYEARNRHRIHHDDEVDDVIWRRWEAAAEPLGLGVLHRVNTAVTVDIEALADACRTSS